MFMLGLFLMSYSILEASHVSLPKGEVDVDKLIISVLHDKFP